MKAKLKVALAGLLAALMFSALGNINAAAQTGGHVVAGFDSHVNLHGYDIVGDPVTITIGSFAISCDLATYEGTTSTATVEQLTLTPKYENCWAGGEKVTIHMNGCDYVLTVGKTPTTTDNTVHLVCTGTNTPIITVNSGFGTCDIHITPNQTPSGGVQYTNSSNHLVLHFTVTELHAVLNTGFFVCGVSNGHTTFASMHGAATLEGSNTSGSEVAIEAT